jgi:hypothetical protein
MWDVLPNPIYEKEILLLRKRNNKLNIYLSDEELKILKDKSLKIGLNQSDFIRNKITSEETTTVASINTKDIMFKISDNLNALELLKNKLHLLGYPELENNILKVINNLKNIQNIIKGND